MNTVQIGGIAVTAMTLDRDELCDCEHEERCVCSEFCERLCELEEAHVGDSLLCMELMLLGPAVIPQRFEDAVGVAMECAHRDMLCRRLMAIHRVAPSLYRSTLWCLSGDTSRITESYQAAATRTGEHKQGVHYTWRREIAALSGLMPAVATVLLQLRESAARAEDAPSDADVLEHLSDRSTRYE